MITLDANAAASGPALWPGAAVSGAADGSGFAALLDQSAAAAAAQVQAGQPDAFGHEIIDSVFVAEWCLQDPAVGVTAGTTIKRGSGEADAEPQPRTSARQEDPSALSAILWLGMPVLPAIRPIEHPAAAETAAGPRLGLAINGEAGLAPAAGEHGASGWMQGPRGAERSPEADPIAKMFELEPAAPPAGDANGLVHFDFEHVEPVPAEPEPFALPQTKQRSAAAQLNRVIEWLGAGPGGQSVSASQMESNAAGQDASRGFGPSSAAAQLDVEHRATPRISAPELAAVFAAELQRPTSAAGAVDAAAEPAALPGGVPDGEVAQQMVDAIRMQYRDGIGTAVLHLKPEHLGDVSIALRVEQQSVSATIHAEVPAVRHWLEAHAESLRSSLQDQGLQLDDFSVREDERREDRGRNADDERPRRHRRQADDQLFEVMV